MSITISLTKKEAEALMAIISQWDYRAADETEYDEIAFVISEKVRKRLKLKNRINMLMQYDRSKNDKM